jgi:hypothetical protein
VPKDIEVASSAEPSQLHVNPDWLLRAAVHGWKWSEHMAAVKPAASARRASVRSLEGECCS